VYFYYLYNAIVCPYERFDDKVHEIITIDITWPKKVSSFHPNFLLKCFI